MLAEIDRAATRSLLDRENLQLRLEYLTALLDGLTGGLWTSEPDTEPEAS